MGTKTTEQIENEVSQAKTIDIERFVELLEDVMTNMSSVKKGDEEALDKNRMVMKKLEGKFKRSLTDDQNDRLKVYKAEMKSTQSYKSTSPEYSHTETTEHQVTGMKALSKLTDQLHKFRQSETDRVKGRAYYYERNTSVSRDNAFEYIEIIKEGLKTPTSKAEGKHHRDNQVRPLGVTERPRDNQVRPLGEEEHPRDNQVTPMGRRKN